MKSRKFLITALIAVALVNAAFLSLAAAQDQPDVTVPPKPSDEPDRAASDQIDNSTQPNDDNILYTIQDNSTLEDDTGPEIAQPNLIAAPEDSSSDSFVLVVAGGAVAFVAISTVLGVFISRKRHRAHN